jgi:hypothetical protein
VELSGGQTGALEHGSIDYGGAPPRLSWRITKEKKTWGVNGGVLTTSSPGVQRRWWLELGWPDGDAIVFDFRRLRRRLKLEFVGYVGSG